MLSLNRAERSTRFVIIAGSIKGIIKNPKDVKSMKGSIKGSIDKPKNIKSMKGSIEKPKNIKSIKGVEGNHMSQM